MCLLGTNDAAHSGVHATSRLTLTPAIATTAPPQAHVHHQFPASRPPSPPAPACDRNDLSARHPDAGRRVQPGRFCQHAAECAHRGNLGK